MTHLAPTAVALAIYFCIADLVLISQCLYYNTLNAQRASRRRRLSSGAIVDAAATVDEEAAEDEPLLNRRRSSSIGLPGSHRRHSQRRQSSNLEPIRRIITGEDETPDSNPWLHNTLSLVAVYGVGAAGWFVSYKMGAWGSAPPAPDVPAEEPHGASEAVAVLGLTLGYLSAACYLFARIPQIIKNYREKSCEGALIL